MANRGLGCQSGLEDRRPRRLSFAAWFFTESNIPCHPPSRRVPEDLPAHCSTSVKALAVVLREEFDTPFRFYDSATGDRVVVPEQAENVRAAVPEERALALELAAEPQPEGRRPRRRRAISSVFPWTGSVRPAWSPSGSSTPWPGHRRRGPGAVAARQVDSIGS